ncbi:MotA/TolQ/ExbB proton channel family protein [Pseudomaricurvus sp. HS19]|uniref:MotA/TolQ/ExbB proton channel family protein n=1 Tax=Pseudomaricurvus sp. HS19 TaxID=2692626 RepID=UPI00136FB0EF|nr:MotA/TolQ/ExbB proton channel family protein [Pseudomaricurvus sp. HS19]MYM63478.1 MotA/TolQ/ExbB proton channel family protein [Pseudomaricurvus sp. HS19]
MLALMDALAAIEALLAKGGPILLWISALTLVMWTLIFERLWYFKSSLKGEIQTALDSWESRPERKSWNAHQVRYALVSRVSEKVNANLDMIATLVALAPLLGLLGTVTGMIEVFNVLAVTGGGDAKSMAGGVSKATIPTMAGMVAALSGVFGNTYVNRIAERENQLLEDHLTMDH